MTEELAATFERLKATFGIDLPPSRRTLEQLQKKQLPLDGREEDVARMLAPELLRYNETWQQIDVMLDDAMSPAFRNAMPDDAGGGWVYSWHCLDHVGYTKNPRRKAIGYGTVFEFYKNKVAATGSSTDELNWHFHPLSFTRDPTQCATSYVNSYDVLVQVLARRVIDHGWFPLVNRPGFHSERPDSHAFLEQWIPYDYANQAGSQEDNQPDLAGGRFGDWRRAPHSWTGYHPHHDDYQSVGHCRRWIFRCMNMGTRIRILTPDHVDHAFGEARNKGSAILAFANHDYRDIRPDVNQVREMLTTVKKRYPNVNMRYAGALSAARLHTQHMEPHELEPLQLQAEVKDNVLSVTVSRGKLFGPQPFLALKTKQGQYRHDNFDVQEPGRHYTYTFDAQTIDPGELATIGIASAGRDGSTAVHLLRMQEGVQAAA